MLQPVSDFARRVGEIVKARRKFLKITQEELAHRSGLHRNTVRGFEAGDSGLRLDNLEKLAGALGIEDPAELLPPPESMPSAELVERYLESPWAEIDKPTPKEIDWLRKSPVIKWMGDSPTEESIHLLLEARRKS